MEKEILIEGFTKKGDGFGRVESGRVDVPHACPGDLVLAHLYKKRRNFIKSKILKIIIPSPHRVEAPCPHALFCGGCLWQGIDYRFQLEEKERSIKSPHSPIIPSELYHYRNKMEFNFSQNRAGTKFLGLMMGRQSRFVFDVNSCFIAPPWMASFLNALRIWWHASSLDAYNPLQNSGLLKTVTLRHSRSGEKMVILTTINGHLPLEAEKSLIELTQKELTNASLFVRVQKCAPKVPTSFEEKLLLGSPFIKETLRINDKDFVFKISPSSFFQPNTFQAEKIYSIVLSLLSPYQPATIYDLYSGTGTFAIALASIAKEVVAVELNPSSIADAKENASLNSISNVTFYQGDVEDVISTLTGSPDAVVLDPPRAGLSPLALTHLEKIAPKIIVYVSCNPETQAANIEALTGYTLKHLQPVDQFPHTPHMETVALLLKK